MRRRQKRERCVECGRFDGFVKRCSFTREFSVSGGAKLAECFNAFLFPLQSLKKEVDWDREENKSTVGESSSDYRHPHDSVSTNFCFFFLPVPTLRRRRSLETLGTLALELHAWVPHPAAGCTRCGCRRRLGSAAGTSQRLS